MKHGYKFAWILIYWEIGLFPQGTFVHETIHSLPLSLSLVAPLYGCPVHVYELVMKQYRCVVSQTWSEGRLKLGRGGGRIS